MKEGVLYSRESNTGIVGKHSISTSPPGTQWVCTVRVCSRLCIHSKTCYTCHQTSRYLSHLAHSCLPPRNGCNSIFLSHPQSLQGSEPVVYMDNRYGQALWFRVIGTPTQSQKYKPPIYFDIYMFWVCLWQPACSGRHIGSNTGRASWYMCIQSKPGLSIVAREV